MHAPQTAQKNQQHQHYSHEPHNPHGGHAPHGHSHGSGSIPNADDPGVRLMRFMAMTQHLTHGNATGWISNYRNKRFIPTSDHALIATFVVLAAGVAGWYFLPAGIRLLSLILIIPSAAYLLLLVVGGFLFTLFMRRRRSEIEQHILGSIRWRGDEQVLDVACGSGILVNNAAKRLTTGKATGIDIWQADSGGGTLKMLTENIAAEGVGDKVEVLDMDARKMTFDDSKFDVVMSSMALHHIGANRAEIEEALREMIRVLKPGGSLALVDMTPLISAATEFLVHEGMKVSSEHQGKFFRFVTVTK